MVIDIIAYVLLLFFTILLVVYEILDQNHRFHSTLIRIRNDCIFTYTLISTISMVYIQVKSAKLRELGIKQSYLIMTLYVILLILISIVTAVSTRIFDEIQEEEDKGMKESDRYYRLDISFNSLYALLHALFSALDIVIVLTYVKFSNRLSDEEI